MKKLLVTLLLLVTTSAQCGSWGTPRKFVDLKTGFNKQVTYVCVDKFWIDSYRDDLRDCIKDGDWAVNFERGSNVFTYNHGCHELALDLNCKIANKKDLAWQRK